MGIEKKKKITVKFVNISDLFWKIDNSSFFIQWLYLLIYCLVHTLTSLII